MGRDPGERVSHRAERRRARLLANEERHEERRLRIVTVDEGASAHPAGQRRGRLRARVAAFMYDVEPLDSSWL